MSGKTINQILLDLREAHDLKQKDIAKILNISQQTYSNYERGKREIPVYHLKALAEYYNTSLDYILGTSITLSGNSSNLRELIDGITIQELIYEIDQLPRQGKQDLLKYLHYLRSIYSHSSYK